LLIEWAPITEFIAPPPFDGDLLNHLKKRKGAGKTASYSAWWLLYRILKNNGMSIGRVAFTDTGKPFFVGDAVFFSLSHSKELCAVSVSDRPVGVDVEICREDYNPHLVERSMTKGERAAFDGDFTRLWCRKESVAKLTGEGIAGYPNRIDTLSPRYAYIERKLEFNGHTYWLVTAGINSYQVQGEENGYETGK
jgi:phosphopantetheinyl transferase